MAKPKIYILHGWSVSAENEQKWTQFLDLLRTAEYEPIFLPIPGLSAPLDVAWQLRDFVEWLAAELPLEPVVLLGHSFGGQIAVRFAALYPERVSRLVLVDSGGIRDHSLIPTVKRAAFLMAAKVGKLFFKSELAKKILYTLARERDYHSAPPLLKRTMSNILDDEVILDLSKINCPVLLIWGTQDTVTPLKLGKQFHAVLPQSNLVQIQGARHSPQFTHPREVVAAIQAFHPRSKSSKKLGEQ